MDRINPYKLKISQLRALVAIADHKNFSEAALHLDLSQSAISHAIANLEDELGVLLLSRGRHGANPTPVGERVIDQSRQVLQLLEGIIKEANREKGLHGGQVRIAAFRSVATHILPSVIARFRRQFPAITVAITEFDDFVGVEQSLRESHADIGFTYLPSGEEFETWELLRDDYVVLLPPNSGFKSPKMTWEQLACYPLIVPATNSCSLRIRNHLRTAEYPLKIAYEVREDSTIVSMVMQNLGAAILPRLAAEPVPPGIQVCSLPAPLQRIIGTAVIINALHTPAVYAFLDALKNLERFNTKAAV
ncbi:MAG TPA: LysR family transcriptional regulator [Stenomitos sp.]